ncbi:MAG: helix-turn-helix domain-containing protein [Xanthomonadales bacterium]|nr:helix-turn-helix domain-containing protein [Xanthomonadales bacterium]
MSQAEVARRVGVSAASLSRWEAGAGVPSSGNLEALAATLRTTVSALYSSTGVLAPLDVATLADSINCMEQSLGNSFQSLPYNQKAKLLGYVYARGGQVTDQEAKALVALLQ